MTYGRDRVVVTSIKERRAEKRERAVEAGELVRKRKR
jgi:hypothetical protein